VFRKRPFLIQLKKRSRPGRVLLLQRILGNPYLDIIPTDIAARRAYYVGSGSFAPGCKEVKRVKKRFVLLALGVLFTSAVVACSSSDSSQTAERTSSTALDNAREKIQHVVVIMQENRSFDHYFGTYPGAEGIPMQDGVLGLS
jgi:hypothetical protein